MALYGMQRMQSKSSAPHNYADYLTIFHAKTGVPVYVHATVAEKMLSSGLYHSLKRHLTSYQTDGSFALHTNLEKNHEERKQDYEQSVCSECPQDEKGHEANDVDTYTGCLRASAQCGSDRLSNHEEKDVTCVDRHIKANEKKRGRPKKGLMA